MRVLDALSVVAVVGAAVLLVWPGRTTVTPIPISAVPVARAAERGTNASSSGRAIDSTGTQIVAGNLFSASRRAPATAFVPPGMDGSTVSVGMDNDASVDGGADAATATDVDESSRPQLFGIVTQDGQRRALLQLPGADAIPRLMAVGERRAGYRVVSIADHGVVVASSTGSRTLRLAPRTSPDSLENLP